MVEDFKLNNSYFEEQFYKNKSNKVTYYHKRSGDFNFFTEESNNPKYINSLSDLQQYGINVGSDYLYFKSKKFYHKNKTMRYIINRLNDNGYNFYCKYMEIWNVEGEATLKLPKNKPYIAELLCIVLDYNSFEFNINGRRGIVQKDIMEILNNGKI